MAGCWSDFYCYGIKARLLSPGLNANLLPDLAV